MPAVVDLAAMRDAMQHLGGDPAKINPLVPVDLVIDHSVQVDFFGSADAFKKNVEIEYERNKERYEFLRWGAGAFNNFRVVPPGTGICHQVNLEYLAQTVWTKEEVGRTTQAFPDTCVGTDSHTTMVNALGVLGWGVGGIEAEAAMLGQPVAMVIPEVVGLRLQGQAQGRRDGHRPRAHLHADAAKARRGREVRRVLRRGPRQPLGGRPCHHRQHGARVRRDLRLLPGRCRHHQVPEGHRPLGRARGARGGLLQGPGAVARRAAPSRSSPTCWSSISSTVEPSMAGPKRPQDRVALAQAKAGFAAVLPDIVKGADLKRRVKVEGADYDLGNGDVVIAAITSCTNTSNPSVLIAAGLLARNARAKGLKAAAVGEDLAGARVPGGHRLSRQGRPAGRPRRARLQPGGLRLHHLHRQLRAAAGQHRRRGARQRPRGGGRAVGQPQLRGPRQPRREGELPGLAAAGRRLRHRRHAQPRPDLGAARHRLGRQARLSRGHLADVHGDRRVSSAPRSRRTCSPSATARCSRATRSGAPWARPRRA